MFKSRAHKRDNVVLDAFKMLQNYDQEIEINYRDRGKSHGRGTFSYSGGNIMVPGTTNKYYQRVAKLFSDQKGMSWQKWIEENIH